MACVVRVPSQYCKCPVDLFRHYQARQLMRQRHGAERQQGLGPLACAVGPATRRPNGENNGLLPGIFAFAQPFGERLGGERLAAAIEQD